MVTREQLIKTSKWVGFVGIMTIITGVFQLIAGLFVYIIGAIPGLITIIMGLKLFNVKKSADKIISLNPDNQDDQLFLIFFNLNTYFKIQGILIIIGLAILVITILTRSF